MRYFLTGILLLAGLMLAACDDAPDEAKTQTLQDNGIFKAEAATDDGIAASPGLGIVRARKVSLDQSNAGLTALLKTVSEKTVANTDKSGLGKYALTLNLFPDVVVSVELEASPGSTGLPEFFGGTVVGDQTSLVTLMHRNGAFSGNVRYGGKLFRIRDEGDNLYRVEEAAPVNLPGHKASDVLKN
jgi:hypothetical protein